MSDFAINAERIKTPHVEVSNRGRHKPPAPRKRMAVAWIQERMGLWFTEKSRLYYQALQNWSE